MEEIDTIKQKETLTFSETYNNLLWELSRNFEKSTNFNPISELLKKSLQNNFKKSILAADEKINQTYSMNKAIINFIMKHNFTMLHLELVEFDAAFRNNSLQNRKARLEFACYFDTDKKNKYLLMDVQKEILLTDVTGNLIFKNEFSNSLQPKFDDYVNDDYIQLGNKTSNTKIIGIKKTDFTQLLEDSDFSSESAQIIFHPIIIKDRDIPLYRIIEKDVTRYKDQFSLFMISENEDISNQTNPSSAHDTFCLTPPDGC